MKIEFENGSTIENIPSTGKVTRGKRAELITLIDDDISKQECCKNCVSLEFYDVYFCNDESIQNIDNPEILIIQDIENCRCELYEERKGKFWLNGEW